jgi:hypothetical protein
MYAVSTLLVRGVYHHTVSRFGGHHLLLWVLQSFPCHTDMDISRVHNFPEASQCNIARRYEIILQYDFTLVYMPIMK